MNKDKQVTVLYHDKCLDGAASAAVVVQCDVRNASAIQCIPVRYDEPPPKIGARMQILYIVDFSYKASILLQLATEHDRVVVIDHHQTAAEELSMERFAKTGNSVSFDGRIMRVGENLEIVMSQDHSGCVLVWQYFHRDNPYAIPDALQYIEDRDLWRFQLPNSRQIAAALQIYPLSIEYLRSKILNWSSRNALNESSVASMAIQSVVSLQLASRLWAALPKDVEKNKRIMVLTSDQLDKMTVWGLDTYDVVPFLNATAFISETLHELQRMEPTANFVASTRLRADGRAEWSLRTNQPDVDVSEVAKRFGGGGHRKAAGFTSEDTPNQATIQHEQESK